MKVLKVIVRCLCLISLLGCSFGLFLYFSRDDSLVYDTYEFTSSKLPKSYSKTIVQLSDLHNHSLFYKDNVSLLDKIDEAKPDYILATGDFIDDHTNNEDLERINTIFTHFEEKGYPVYFVNGNHEAKVKDKTIVEKSTALMKKHGATEIDGVDTSKKVYQGYRVDLDSYITVSGLADQAYTGSDQAFFHEQFGNVEEQLNNLDSGLTSTKFNILLTHRPENFKKSQTHAYDLTLSGHTHGGQAKIGNWHVLSWGIPYPSYLEGLYEEKGQSLIVSRGLGTSFYAPFRYNCPATIVVSHLKGH